MQATSMRLRWLKVDFKTDRIAAVRYREFAEGEKGVRNIWYYPSKNIARILCDTSTIVINLGRADMYEYSVLPNRDGASDDDGEY